MSDLNKNDDYVYDNGFKPKEVVLKENYQFYPKNLWRSFLFYLFTGLTGIVLFFYKVFTGYRVYGKKNLRKHKQGNMIICNHIHPIDCLLLITSIQPIRTYITTLQSNMGFGLVSWYFRVGGAVPIPNDLKMLRKFNEQTNDVLTNRKQNIIFLPEASLHPYCDHIREFKAGAFHYAYNSNCSILPCVFTYHKPKGLIKLFRRKKPCLHLHIMPAYQFNDMGTKRDTVDKMSSDMFNLLNDTFIRETNWRKQE